MLDARRSKVSKPQSAKSKKSKPSTSKTSAAKPASALLDKSNEAPKRARTINPAKSSPPPPPIIMPSSTTTDPIPLPPLKDLASSTPSLRRAALTALLTHLASRPPTAPPTPTQAQQLWRALYVSLYMHDSKSAISVQNHARTLAGTVRGGWGKDREAAASAAQKSGGDVKAGGGEEGLWTWSRTWAGAFWGEMAREWIGVDQWRMNKVLMLVRMVVAEGVGCAVESALTTPTEGQGGEGHDGIGNGGDSWRDYVAEVVALPLEVQRSLPDGLRMHVLDVWGDELEKLVEGEGEEGEGADLEAGRKREVVNMLVQAAKELSVFRQGEANVPKNVRARAKEIVQTYGAQ